MIELTFVRHGETDANASGVWQGQGDADLSAAGQRQALALRDRLAGREFDTIVSSDLRRTGSTSALAGLEPHPDPDWREVDIGDWEGLTRDEVHARYPEDIAALAVGEPLKLGGGESWREFGERIDGALERLIAAASDGQSIAVVAHGGVIHSVVSGLLGFHDRPRPWPIEHLSNTSLTVIRIDENGRHLITLNDAGHVRDGPVAGSDAVFGMIRHGETAANLEERFAGTTDVPLTDVGRRQAAALPSRYDGAAHVYSSPLVRCVETAQAFADAHGLDVTVRDDLHEIHFGAWENLSATEIAERFPEEWRRIYIEGFDDPRGGTGETAEAAGRRFRKAIEDLATLHGGERVAVVAHGGVIRSFVGGLVGVGHSERDRLALPGNTSVTHVRVGEALSLVDYNLGAA